MQNQYPSVYPLTVHLENEQPIYFTDNTIIEDSLNNSKSTTLTEWFETKKYLQKVHILNILIFVKNLFGIKV